MIYFKIKKVKQKENLKKPTNNKSILELLKENSVQVTTSRDKDIETLQISFVKCYY